MFLRGIIHYKDGFKIEKEEETNFSIVCNKIKNWSYKNKLKPANSLVAQCLRLRTSIAEGMGSVPGLGIKIPQAASCDQLINWLVSAGFSYT